LALVRQAPLLDGPALDAFAFERACLFSAGVDVGWREVAQALLVALVMGVLDEGGDLRPLVASVTE
jgi:hypothetical protein